MFETEGSCAAVPSPVGSGDEPEGDSTFLDRRPGPRVCMRSYNLLNPYYRTIRRSPSTESAEWSPFADSPSSSSPQIEQRPLLESVAAGHGGCSPFQTLSTALCGVIRVATKGATGISPRPAIQMDVITHCHFGRCRRGTENSLKQPGRHAVCLVTRATEGSWACPRRGEEFHGR